MHREKIVRGEQHETGAERPPDDDGEEHIMKTPRRYLLVLAAVGLFAAACGGDEPADTADETTEESGEDTGEEDAGEEDVGDDGAEEDGEQGGASGVDLDALYEAALEEGEVIAYIGSAESSVDSVVEGFNEQYPGVEVQSIRLNSAGIAQRFGAERESGAPTADVIQGGFVEFQLNALEEGWVVPSEELPLPEEFPSDFMHPLLGPIQGYPLPVILYNTDLVGEDEIPTTWEDLADPRWQGQVLMADLEEQVWHVGVYGTVIGEFGEEWAEGFMANEPRVIAGGVAPITELIAAGEAAVAPIGFAPIAEAVKASGAPIDHTTPDPQTSVPAFMAINSEAENPNAARLLYHYMHTQDGIERLTLFGTHAPYQTDRDYEWVEDDLRWVTDPEWADEIAALFGQ